MAADDKVVGTASSYMTPKNYTKRATVERTACDKHVPPAADSIIGHCEYYYRPLHCAYVETVEKVSVSSISSAAAYAAIKLFAHTFNPWTDVEVTERLLKRREQLIPPDCTDSDWSRHSNFMMRHIGCGHKPPSYYIGYGYYYCSNYGAKLFPRLSPVGQAWLVSARKLLQQNMEDGLKQNMRGNVIQMSAQKPGNGSFRMEIQQYLLELNDETFKTFAFKTHPLAYLDGGLGALPTSDLMKIAAQPNAQEWADGRTWGQAVDSGEVVVKDWVNQALDHLQAK
jgi:hypothetical protein